MHATTPTHMFMLHGFRITVLEVTQLLRNQENCCLEKLYLLTSHRVKAYIRRLEIHDVIKFFTRCATPFTLWPTTQIRVRRRKLGSKYEDLDDAFGVPTIDFVSKFDVSVTGSYL